MRAPLPIRETKVERIQFRQNKGVIKIYILCMLCCIPFPVHNSRVVALCRFHLLSLLSALQLEIKRSNIEFPLWDNIIVA